MAINEDGMSQALDRACNNPSLYFQITAQGANLSIFINREAESQLDYPALTETIRKAIAPFPLPPEIEYLVLYSRIDGVSNPDWEISIKLEQPSTGESIALDSTPEAVEAEPGKTRPSLDLSQYSLIRNREKTIPEPETDSPAPEPDMEVPPSSPTLRTRPKRKKKTAAKFQWLPMATVACVFLTIFAIVTIQLFQEGLITISLLLVFIINFVCSAIALLLVCLIPWIGIIVNS